MKLGTVLVVDDDKGIRDLFKAILRSIGFEVLEAEGGIPAVNILLRKDVDAVVTDLAMPDVDGMDLLRTVMESDRPVPVIMVTAAGSIKQAVEAMRLGAYDFVEKPFDVESLKVVVRRAVSEYKKHGAKALPPRASHPAPQATPPLPPPLGRENTPARIVPQAKDGKEWIGRYEVLNVVGVGGIGTVYRCRDSAIGRLVAIKTVHPHLLADPSRGDELLRRFKREAQAAGVLTHPNIVSIYDVVIQEAERNAYIVMEHVNGPSLGEVMDRLCPLPLPFALSVAIQMAASLAHAHSRHVVHRDVKPGNIIIHKGNTAKLTDFGVARLGWAEVTGDGERLGTPSYMAPEQIRFGKADEMTDQFSLGVVIYEMLAGRKAFQGESVESRIRAVLHSEIRPLNKVAVGLPVAICDLVHRMISLERNDRFPTWSDVMMALRDAAEIGRVSLNPKPSILPLLQKKDVAVAR